MAGTAARQVVLGGAAVPYRLERARRHSIGFIVGDAGLVVRAPGWVTLAAIESALQEKSDWIVRHLARHAQRARQQEAARIAWRDGGTLPWLGAPLTLRLDGIGHAPLRIGAALHLPPAFGGAPIALRASVQAWAQREARRHFAERLAHFAPQLGVRWQRLVLSSAATRWGSASASGTIRLNWRLMHYREALIDSVVVHELAHLREMNHSPRFWAIVATVVPEHAALRRELRELAAPLWD